VLRDPNLRARLIERLPEVDRLVLLGDVIELRHGPARTALQQAQPILVEITQALGSGAEIVLVPGNHDHRLLAPWASRRALRDGAAPIGLEASVDSEPGEPLWALAEALGPERLRVAYPGVWLAEKTYATHGHYGDRHTTLPILERLGAGLTARVVGEPPAGPGRAEDYEATLAPVYAWIDAIAEHGGPALPGSGAGMQARLWQRMSRRGRRAAIGRILTAAGVRAVVAGLNRAGIGPLRADLSSQELRLAALRAFAEVVRRLDVPAQHVIFGHTHRAGPLPGDDLAEWRTGTGTGLLNTGSWIHEPSFLGRTPRQSPYRPGFAAQLSDGAAPQLINLLDQDRPDPA
jgi:predicted phosphodiesterase